MNKTPKQKRKIISFCDYKYLRLAILWVKEIQKLNICDYVIIANDTNTYHQLRKQNINTRLVKFDKNKGLKHFWKHRTKVIYQYLGDGFDVIHSDIDAIWKQDISSQFNRTDIDIYISQGTTHPLNALNKHKFVMCCGFYYAKSNDRVLNFFKILLEGFNEPAYDDQKVLNTLLIETEWDKSKGIPLPANYQYFTTDIIGINREFNLKLCLISMLKIQRVYLNQKAYIYHLLAPKSCKAKLDTFYKAGIIKQPISNKLFNKLLIVKRGFCKWFDKVIHRPQKDKH